MTKSVLEQYASIFKKIRKACGMVVKKNSLQISQSSQVSSHTVKSLCQAGLMLQKIMPLEMEVEQKLAEQTNLSANDIEIMRAFIAKIDQNG